MIDLTGRTDVPVVEEVLDELVTTCRDIDIEFLVVGAAARDLVIHAHQHSQPVRATKDIDIAMSDGSAVVDVLKDVQLRSQLIRDMRGGLSPSLLDAYERGSLRDLGNETLPHITWPPAPRTT